MEPAVLGFWQQRLDRVHALSDVESAAAGTAIPLTDDHSRTDITVEGTAIPKPKGYPHPDTHIVSPGYEKALGIRLSRGRGFTDADRENAPRVALVNATVDVLGMAPDACSADMLCSDSLARPNHGGSLMTTGGG